MAYTATVVLLTPRPQRLSRDMGMIMGTCDITAYHTTGVEITDITKYFSTILHVFNNPISDANYIISWNRTDKCFHAFAPIFVLDSDTPDTPGNALYFDDDGTTGKLVSTTAGNADAYDLFYEAADDADVGLVTFMAIGLR